MDLVVHWTWQNRVVSAWLDVLKGEEGRESERALDNSVESFFPLQGTTDGGWSGMGGQGKLLWLLLFLVFVLRKELFAAHLLADGNVPVEREKPLTWKRKGSTTGVMCLMRCTTRNPGPQWRGCWQHGWGLHGHRKGAGVQRHLGQVGRCGGGRNVARGASHPKTESQESEGRREN